MTAAAHEESLSAVPPGTLARALERVGGAPDAKVTMLFASKLNLFTSRCTHTAAALLRALVRPAWGVPESLQMHHMGYSWITAIPVVLYVRAARASCRRAYNEAVIGGGGGADEQLAHALQEEEVAGAMGRAAGARSAQVARGRAGRPTPSVKERLARKLLGGRAVNRATQEIQTADDEIRRDKFGGRWEER